MHYKLFAVLLLIFGVFKIASPACAGSIAEETLYQNEKGSGEFTRKLGPVELGQLISELSEESGNYPSDNLVSNEASYVEAIPRLKKMGGVYIGVGPEQNFSYMARIRPDWAFILDIRRENMLQHLLYIAILEKAETPYEYLCWLFSRPVRTETGLSNSSDIVEIIAAVEAGAPRLEVFERNLEAILEHVDNILGETRKPGDHDAIRFIYSSFYKEQLNIHYRRHIKNDRSHQPTYRSLLLAQDMAMKRANFLAFPENYDYVRALAQSGHLVPVVGDFAGPHALHSIADYIKIQGETVSAFYVSNVEAYLIDGGKFNSYVNNIKALPVANDSIFIRSHFHKKPGPPLYIHRDQMLIHKMMQFLALYDSGAYRTYPDVIFLTDNLQ